MKKLDRLWDIKAGAWIRFFYEQGQLVVQSATPIKGGQLEDGAQSVDFWETLTGDAIPVEGWQLFSPEEKRTAHYRIDPIRQRVLRRTEIEDKGPSDQIIYRQTYEQWSETKKSFLEINDHEFFKPGSLNQAEALLTRLPSLGVLPDSKQYSPNPQFKQIVPINPSGREFWWDLKSRCWLRLELGDDGALRCYSAVPDTQDNPYQVSRWSKATELLGGSELELWDGNVRQKFIWSMNGQLRRHRLNKVSGDVSTDVFHPSEQRWVKEVRPLGAAPTLLDSKVECPPAILEPKKIVFWPHSSAFEGKATVSSESKEVEGDVDPAIKKFAELKRYVMNELLARTISQRQYVRLLRFLLTDNATAESLDEETRKLAQDFSQEFLSPEGLHYFSIPGVTVGACRQAVRECLLEQYALFEKSAPVSEVKSECSEVWEVLVGTPLINLTDQLGVLAQASGEELPELMSEMKLTRQQVQVLLQAAAEMDEEEDRLSLRGRVLYHYLLKSNCSPETITAWREHNAARLTQNLNQALGILSPLTSKAFRESEDPVDEKRREKFLAELSVEKEERISKESKKAEGMPPAVFELIIEYQILFNQYNRWVQKPSSDSKEEVKEEKGMPLFITRIRKMFEDEKGAVDPKKKEELFFRYRFLKDYFVTIYLLLLDSAKDTQQEIVEELDRLMDAGICDGGLGGDLQQIVRRLAPMSSETAFLAKVRDQIWYEISEEYIGLCQPAIYEGNYVHLHNEFARFAASRGWVDRNKGLVDPHLATAGGQYAVYRNSVPGVVLENAGRVFIKKYQERLVKEFISFYQSEYDALVRAARTRRLLEKDWNLVFGFLLDEGIFQVSGDLIDPMSGSFNPAFASKLPGYVMQYLLKKRIIMADDVGRIPDEKEYTPLMRAVQSNDAKAVGALLADATFDAVNYSNRDGETALCLAARLGNLGIVRQLLASPFVITEYRDSESKGLFKNPALDAAIKNDRLDIVIALLAKSMRHKASLTWPKSENLRIQEILEVYLSIQNPVRHNPDDTINFIPIMMEAKMEEALEKEEADTVSLLYQAGVRLPLKGLGLRAATVVALYEAGHRDFREVILTGKFENCDLSGADFTGADFDSAAFHNVNFTGAVLKGRRIEIRMSLALMLGAVETISSLYQAGVRWPLNGLCLSQKVIVLLYQAGHRDFREVILTGKFENCDLSEADFTWAHFKLAYFHNVKFSEAVLKSREMEVRMEVALQGGEDREDETFRSLYQAGVRVPLKGLVLDQRKITALYQAGHRDFRGVHFCGKFEGCDLSEADFTEAFFSWAYFHNVNFSEAVWKSKEMEKRMKAALEGDEGREDETFHSLYQAGVRVPLKGLVLGQRRITALYQAGHRDFRKVVLTGKFENCDFSEADFSEAVIHDSFCFHNANIPGLAIPKKEMKSAPTKEEAKAEHKVARGLYDILQLRKGLAGARLDAEGVLKSYRAGVRSFAHIKCVGIDFTAPMFREIDLREIDFRGTDLTGCNFSEHNLHGTNFEGAILNGAKFTRAEFCSTNFRGAKFFSEDAKEGYDMKLQIASLPFDENTNLEPLDLDISQIRSLGKIGCRSFRKVSIRCDDSNTPITSDFKGFDFSGAKFKGVSLIDADCQGANFKGAHFDSKVRFGGTNVVGAQFTLKNFPIQSLQGLILHTKDSDIRLKKAIYVLIQYLIESKEEHGKQRAKSLLIELVRRQNVSGPKMQEFLISGKVSDVDIFSGPSLFNPRRSTRLRRLLKEKLEEAAAPAAGAGHH